MESWKMKYSMLQITTLSSSILCTNNHLSIYIYALYFWLIIWVDAAVTPYFQVACSIFEHVWL